MSLLLKSGHKINKPTPLFTKIEQSRVDELKKKYGGSQDQRLARETKVEKSKFFSTIEEAEKAVADQGEKVRKLKSSGVEKSIWQPEVNILLELKKQLDGLRTQTGEKKSSSTTSTPAPAQSSNTPSVASPDDIKKLEADIVEQVNRSMSESFHQILDILFLFSSRTGQ